MDDSDIKQTPLVSVAMITYNHAPYIRRAIESVQAQMTNFPIELVIGEDSSRDETRNIIKSCMAETPIEIRLLGNERNLGMHANLRRTLAACRGKYVAMLEGDDYWISANKLQRQVDALERDKEAAFSFHRVRWEYLEGAPRPLNGPAHGEPWPTSPPPVINFASIAAEVFIQTASVVCRKEMLPVYPDWLMHLPWADWAIFLMLADKGRVIFLPEVMSVYQQHADGACAGMGTKDIHRNAYLMFKNLAKEIKPQWHETCHRMAIKHLELLADELEHSGEIVEAKRVLRLSFWEGIKRGEIRHRPLAWFFRLKFPQFHKFRTGD